MPSAGPGPRQKFAISRLCDAHERATYRMIASFASSDGWNRNDPCPIQRCAPLAAMPICGTKTSASNSKLRKTPIFATDFHFQYGK